MKAAIVKVWAIAQIIMGLAIIGATAHYAPPALGKMKSETQRTGTNLHEISEALTAVRATYAETATNLFNSTREMADVETKLVDAGRKLGDVGHMFDQHGRKFAKSERHNRESKIFWGEDGNAICKIHCECLWRFEGVVAHVQHEPVGCG